MKAMLNSILALSLILAPFSNLALAEDQAQFASNTSSFIQQRQADILETQKSLNELNAALATVVVDNNQRMATLKLKEKSFKMLLLLAGVYSATPILIKQFLKTPVTLTESLLLLGAALGVIGVLSNASDRSIEIKLDTDRVAELQKRIDAKTNELAQDQQALNLLQNQN